MNEYLDRILGEEGIKTDVQVSLKPNTYINLGATIVASIVIGMTLGSVVKGILKK